MVAAAAAVAGAAAVAAAGEAAAAVAAAVVVAGDGAVAAGRHTAIQIAWTIKKPRPAADAGAGAVRRLGTPVEGIKRAQVTLSR